MLGAALVAVYALVRGEGADPGAFLSLPGAAALAFWVLVPSALVRGREKSTVKRRNPSNRAQWWMLSAWFVGLIVILAAEFRLAS